MRAYLVPAARLVPAAFLLLAVAQGCDTRVRENPFDPMNPESGGRPSLLTAIARDGFADLRWDDGGMRGIAGFTIHRGENPGALELVAEVSAEDRFLREVGLAPDVTYYFAVGFRFNGQAPLLTEVQAVTPGPDVPWVLDAADPPLALLSADGRAVVSRQAPGADLVDLSVDPSLSLAWSVDPTNGHVVAYDHNGDLDRLWERFDSPTRVSADLESGGVWIISFDKGTLMRVDAAGKRTLVDDTLVGPLDVEASPIGGCWVCDELGQIHRYSPTGDRFTPAQVARPLELSAAGDNEVWIADPVAGEVVKVSNLGVTARAAGFDGPFSVAATPDGGCWVADRERVLRVDGDGEVLLTVEGFIGARAVASNPRTGECWVADSLGDMIVRVSSDGAWVVTMTEVLSPFAVAGRWGRPD